MSQLVTGSDSAVAVELSIIIINYNTTLLLQRCILSILNNVKGIGYEIIVVDNGSSGDIVEIIEENFPAVILIQNSDNMGFAYANNQGMKKATGEVILLLNSDTELNSDSLRIPIQYLINHDHIGIISCNLYNTDGSPQHAARNFPTPINALFGRRSFLTRLFPNSRYVRKYMPVISEKQGQAYEIDWISGAFLMFKREVMESVGLLDDKFFFYWEDTDFCYRAKAEGWRVYCVPEAFIYHHEGTGKRRSNLYVKNFLSYHFYKGAYRFYSKHYINAWYHPLHLIAICGLSIKFFLEVIHNSVRQIIDEKQ